MSEKSALELIQAYKNDLQYYTMEQLLDKPEEGAWSLGQLYNHLIRTSMFMQLRNIEACASSAEDQPLGKTEPGEQIFRLGGFPPIKIKVPDSPQYTPRNPESKEELAAGLDEVARKIMEWADKVDTINPSRKAEHPRLGWMNAREWFDLIGMHFRHHLRQKAELEQRLGLNVSERT